MASGDFPGGGTPERSGGERSVRQGILRKNPCPPEGGSGHFPEKRHRRRGDGPSNARAVLRKHLASHGAERGFRKANAFSGLSENVRRKNCLRAALRGTGAAGIPLSETAAGAGEINGN